MRRIFATGLGLFASASLAATPPDSGKAIATRSGCLSCHGPTLAGRALFDDPTIAILYSSNLSRAAPRYSDRALERTIRAATRPDGSHLWQMAAPYAHLSTTDMRQLIHFIRSVPPNGDDHPRIRIGPRFLKAAHAGRIQPEAIEQAQDTETPPDLGPRHARGRYLARTICAGCHWPSLNGYPHPQDGDAPNLDIAAGYDRAQFRTLLHTGKAIGDREVGVMSEEARKRFADLSDTDVDLIHDYLTARAEHPKPAAK
jgi:cytochrome c553